jgi:tRNA (guanine37-N1)-methyltransferase
MFEGPFSDSIIRRAVEKGIVSIRFEDIRAHSGDERHKSVDDYPYGGSSGMLLKAQPVADAIRASKRRLGDCPSKVVLLSPQGELLTHGVVQDLLKEQALVLVCGRYKGVDERVRERFVDREISIGDYVLSGGEIPAMVLVEAVTRLIPGALGDRESAESDSFYNGLLGPPQYTRPEQFEGMDVPQVLLSGHHEKIRQWQQEQAVSRTRSVRPDLWERYCQGRPELGDESRQAGSA